MGGAAGGNAIVQHDIQGIADSASQEKARKSRDEWDGLERVRASFVERKRDERQTIAITSVLMWAALSGGLAFVWFRKIDWDRVTR